MSFGITANVCHGCGHTFTSGCTPKKYCAACRKKFCKHSWSEGPLLSICVLCGEKKAGTEMMQPPQENLFEPEPEEKAAVPMCAQPVGGAVARLGPPKPKHPNEIAEAREISRLVAEEIMGCKPKQDKGSGVWSCGCDDSEHNMTGEFVTLKKYASSMHFAMEIVYAIGCGFALNWVTASGQDVWMASFQGSPSGQGDNPAIAIARGGLIRKRGLTE